MARNSQQAGVTECRTHESNMDHAIQKTFTNADLLPITHTRSCNSTEWFGLNSQVLPNYNRAVFIMPVQKNDAVWKHPGRAVWNQ